MQINDYGTTVEVLLSKKTDKYDIYFYDNVYTKRYGKHFVNLKEKISKEHMNLFSSDLNYQLCTSDNRWVGLVNILTFLKCFIYNDFNINFIFFHIFFDSP